MRKLNYLIIVMMIATGLFMQSCEKDQAIEQQYAEVSFSIENTGLDLKYSYPDVPECVEEDMSYVVISMANMDDIVSPVIWVDGLPKTQAIKLMVNKDTNGDPIDTDYLLTGFLVYFDNDTPADLSDDVLLMAAPANPSTYWELMDPHHRLNLTVTVKAFKKQEVIIDVLCFEPLSYEYFGFSWFELNEVVIERMCFFGDLCFTDADIALTIPLPPFLFPQVPAIKTYYGGAMDVVAKMKVDIHKVGAANNPISTFTNINDDGSLIEGQCMEIYWANDIIDDPDNPEIFTINLFVLVGEYPGMPVWVPIWMPLATYVFTDNNSPLVGADGVMDFVLGSCGDGSADYPFVWDHAMPYLYIDNVLSN